MSIKQFETNKGAGEMLSKRKQSNTDGFTIIEVLIVLAIAGLILLIVFLAVPALQRNSRNTQRKNDVSALLSGLGEFTSNNGGGLPAQATDITGVVPSSKRSYYKDDNKIKLVAAVPGSVDLDTVYIITGARCTDAKTPAVGAASRSVVAYYAVETSGGGSISQCLESGA